VTHTFRVIDEARVRDWCFYHSARERPESLVVLETDDWVEAWSRALTRNWKPGESLHVEGEHPSHTWDRRRCTACGARKNGSYGSQAPCGYDFRGHSLVTTIDRELQARQAELATERAGERD